MAALPSGKTILDMADSFFTKKVFSTEGRFGAYGAPTDIKVLSTNKAAADAKGARLLELSFSALSPGGTEVARKALVAAYQPEGAANVVMLVGGSTTSAWKKSEPALRAMAASYRIARVRPTSILRKVRLGLGLGRGLGLWLALSLALTRPRTTTASRTRAASTSARTTRSSSSTTSRLYRVRLILEFFFSRDRTSR